MRRATSRRADTDPTVGPKAEPVPFDRDVEAPLRTKPARTAGDPGASSSDGIAPVRRRATAMFPAGLMTIGLATVGLALSGLLVADFLDRAGGPSGATVIASGLVIVQVGLVGLAAVHEWMVRRERDQAAHLRSSMRERLDQASTIIESDPQVAMIWRGGRDAEIAGNPDLMAKLGGRHRVAAFGTWAAPAGAARLEEAVTQLREAGTPFRLTMPLKKERNQHLLAIGEVHDGAALLRLRDEREEAASRVAAETAREAAEAQAAVLRALLEAVPAPVWQRDAKGRVAWSNPAYRAAVKGPTEQAASSEDEGGPSELLSESTRRAMAISRLEGQVFHARTHAVMAGERRTLDAWEVPLENGAAGIAFDATEAETAKAELARHIESYAQTLDQLRTAVAIFGPDKRLLFHNEAYRNLLGLEHAWLLTAPLDSEVLERLREYGRVPEQTDFRAWKRSVLGVYQALEPREDWWAMPDGQMLRVVATPGAEGGVIYFYEDHTERFDLQSRYNTLSRVQGETLDNLREGVAVFASNGRLSFGNPSFAAMWDVAHLLESNPHIDEVIDAIQPAATAGDWRRIKAMVTEIDTRASSGGRMTRADGRVFDYVLQPLPDGATLVTFGDVTDSLAAAKALEERNQALVAADELKNAFVQHVSYELRTPLTHIIGFSQLLAAEQVGTLNDKQREYADDIYTASDALMTIIDHILDLATIDAGAMELAVDDVDVREAVDIAAEGLTDRLREDEITLDVAIEPGVTHVKADPNRLTQVLFNLLSNAVGVSERHGRIGVEVGAVGDGVRFAVSDSGPGLEDADLKRVFDRFETGPKRGRHRGAGLGLSIVESFVALHGGTIEATSAPGTGTTVSVVFPGDPGDGPPKGRDAVPALQEPEGSQPPFTENAPVDALPLPEPA